MGKRNPRAELRAFILPNACRLASILVELTNGGVAGSAATKQEVELVWATRYPHHQPLTGMGKISNRIDQGLTALRAAEIVREQAGKIIVASTSILSMSASNLEILVDEAGNARRAVNWPRTPDVPEHLKAVQAPLEQARREKIAARQS